MSKHVEVDRGGAKDFPAAGQSVCPPPKTVPLFRVIASQLQRAAGFRPVHSRRPKENALNPLNQCAACAADFTSLELFDRHRVGRHEPDGRRCLNADEMTTNGWQRDSRGRSTDPARAMRARGKFAIAA